METCRARPRGSPFHLPAELAVGLDLGSDPHERLPAPVSPVLPPVRKEFGSPVSGFRKEPRLRRLILSRLHADSLGLRDAKSIRQGLKHREVAHR
jgi:hypothetical protein